MLNDINGWIIIDKPLAITSSKAVNIVKSLLKPKKIGHAGTLDPFASGVLPLALGEATKTINFAMDASKEYIFTVKFGEARDTDDREGKVIATSSNIPTHDEITQILPTFLGEIEQTPPIYSALKVAGERAYDLARKGEALELPARKVTIFSIELIRTSNQTNEATLKVHCSKGTYVRALARDLAFKLGSCGYVSHLQRTKVKNFSLKDAISLDKLKSLVHNYPSKDYLLSVEVVLDDIPALKVTEEEVIDLRYGRSILFKNLIEQSSLTKAIAEKTNKLIALGKLDKGYFKPIRVFNH